jgi:adenosine deaminase
VPPQSKSERLASAIRRIAKVELHQHVDGSIPPGRTWSLMKRHGLNPVATRADMNRLLALQPGEEGSLLAYLDKFHYPLWITQFYENIRDVTIAIIADAARHNVRVLELRYSPVIHTLSGITIRQAIRAVLSGMNKARERHRVHVGLIVIAMRQHGPHIAKILARQAISEAQHLHERCAVVGFDIAGAEKGNSPRLFAEAYRIAAAGRLGLTAHAGEDESARYVWEAIDELGVGRLGHACSAVRDRALLRRLARDRILVECALTSNFQTGAARRGEPHPILRFLEAGVPVAVCTDNTTVSSTDQTRENTILGADLPPREISEIHRAAVSHSFIRGADLKPSRVRPARGGSRTQP